MAGPFLRRDYEYASQIESSYDTDPGSWTGAMVFKSKTGNAFKRSVARADRDHDGDYATASVITTQKGRESSDVSFDEFLVPSGVTAAPAAPDMGDFFEAHFGSKTTHAAHSTTTSGSAGTALNLATGGEAAMSLAVGDLIAVDVSAAFGIEVRQITALPGSDVVTVDRAFSANPATGRAVYGGVTYKLSSATLKTLHILQWLNADNFRQKVGGVAIPNMNVACDFATDSPMASVSFSGPGARIAPHTTSRATPTTAGQPLLPEKAYAYIGSTKTCINYVSLESNNGNELRNNASCALYPTGVKRTGNSSRFSIKQTLRVLLETGTIAGYYDVADDLTAYDVIMQLGATVGKIVAWRTRKFIPDVEQGELDGEVSLELSGRCYASADANELVLGFF